MEDSIFSRLIKLFKGYVAILERALIYETNVIEKGDPIINLAVSLQEQITILANLSTLEQLFPKIVRAIYEGIHQINSADINEYLEKELDNFTFSTREASSQLRVQFCHQYISRIMSHEISYKLTPEICGDGMPSVTFQVFSYGFYFFHSYIN